MRRILIFVVVLCAPPAQASAVRVMTWNVGGGYKHRVATGQKPISIQGIAQVMVANKVDVVALQEVCLSQLNALGAELDGQYAFRQTVTRTNLPCSKPGATSAVGSEPSSFGNAIIARKTYPLQSVVSASLPSKRRIRTGSPAGKVVALADEPRKAMAATITVDGKPLRVWSVHVSPYCKCGKPKVFKDPDYQLQYVHDTLVPRVGAGVAAQAIMGDLNVPPSDTDAFAPFTDFADTDGPGVSQGNETVNLTTNEATTAHGKLDYTLVSAGVFPYSAWVVPPPFGTARFDHKPLLSDISVR